MRRAEVRQGEKTWLSTSFFRQPSEILSQVQCSSRSPYRISGQLHRGSRGTASTSAASSATMVSTSALFLGLALVVATVAAPMQEMCNTSHFTFVLVCSVTVHHTGTLPRNLVSRLSLNDLERLKEQVCPCRPPEIGFFCPSFVKDFVKANRCS
ncbi:uncharacterized protein LOC122247612 [Penaeus japonicus]|uniref:uncharacterized protein LOC122247612 n=1 Tax=Penaeus japonicus TaxID=27405 RepID=UPI001C7162DD|nr:uncharacterized protein LOC122247612 [Penaeus japonicus]